jgi:hypothetical protein
MAPHHHNNLPAMLRLAQWRGIFARDPRGASGTLGRWAFRSTLTRDRRTRRETRLSRVSNQHTLPVGGTTAGTVSGWALDVTQW